MSGRLFKNPGNKAHLHLHLHSLWKRPSIISDSIRPPLTRPTPTPTPTKGFSSLPNTNTNTNSNSNPNPTGFVAWYLNHLNTRPLLTKCLTSAFIYSAADLSSQTIAGSSYDPLRTLRMAGYGMIVLGPSLHFWFNFVSTLFPNRDLISTFKKMFMGQAIFGPFMTALFFSVNAALQGESGPEIVARLKRDLFPTMINGVMYWPVCDFITFRFIPVNLQPLVSNSFSYIWTVYMTYMASLEKADPK